VVPQGTIAADAGLTPTASKTSAIDTSASFLKSGSLLFQRVSR
jgi:hypothetical protein